MKQVLRELGFADGDIDQAVEEKDGLIWKPILREGHFKLTPTNKGVQNKPFFVVSGLGKSDSRKNIVSIDDLIDSFDKNAFDHVTIPTSHKDTLLENTGHIRQLKKGKDSKGRTTILAGMDITEPDIKGKVERGTIPNCSSGIFFDHVRKTDGVTFPVALKHAALTHNPWVTELEPFGKAITASDEEVDGDSNIEFYQFSDDDEPETQITAADSGEVVWKETNGFQHVRNVLNADLNSLTKGIKIQTGEEVYFYIQDVSPAEALIKNESTQQTFVAPYAKDEDGEPALSSYSDWTEAKEVMVAASDDETEKPATEEPAADETVVEPEVTEENDSDTEIEVSSEDLTKGEEEVTLSYDTTDNSPRQALKRASAERKKRLEASNQSVNIGGKTMGLKKLDLSALQLSDDDRTAIEAVLASAEEIEAENKSLTKTVRETAADEKVEKLKGLGLADNPGALKFYRQVLLADDGDVAGAILLADEDGKEEEKGITLSEALDKFIEYATVDGTLNLSDQGTREESEGHKPPVGDDGAEAKTTEAITAAVEALDEDDPARLALAEDQN